MNKVSKLKTVKVNKTKGRQNVEKKLIESAAVLVGSIGPNQLTHPLLLMFFQFEKEVSHHLESNVS